MRRARSCLPVALLLTAIACGRSETPAPEAPLAPPAAIDGPAEPAPSEPLPPLFDAAELGIPDDPDSIADGRNIAESHCAICHGMDQDASLRWDAPPLRYVLSIYPPDSLAEDFRNGIHVGHQDMPEFVFGPLGMDVLLAYLISIQERP